MAKKESIHDQRYMLSVVDERPWAYIVEHEGKNYPVRKFDFQRRSGLSRPLRVQCIGERQANGSIYFKQDLAPIFAERDKKGQIYDFTIDADMTNAARPHYKVSDGSGYWIPLPAKDDVVLHKGDRVKLRVTSIKGIFLNLELVRDYLPAVAEIPTIPDLAARFGTPFLRLLTTLLRADALPQAKALFEQNDQGWLITGLREARENIFALNDTAASHLAESVGVFRDILTFLLEDSAFLYNAGYQPRNVLQEEFARDVARADDLLTAIQLVEHKQHDRFVRETFDKIRRSGYLYRPESKLRTLMYIFSLRSKLIDKCMDQLIEIIQQGDTDNWKAEPFRSAFVEQLQLYIDACHAQFDTVSDAEADAATANRLDRMIRALAIQQLLEETDATPSEETIINRSRLYRYYAFMKNAERDRMLEKSLHVLLTEDIEDGEYTWSDTTSTMRLMSRLLHAPEPVDGVQKYENGGVVMNIKDSRIEFRAAADNATRPVLPNLGLWHGLQVYLPALLPPELRTPRSIGDYRSVWNEIEHRLFQERRVRRAPEPVVVKERIRMPEVGEVVDITVDRSVDEGLYTCHVVETGFYGDGTLDIREISGSRRPLHIKAFRDTDGNPLLFKAKVIASDDNTLRFSLLEEIRRYVREMVDIDDEVACVINNTPSRANDFTYTGLTEHGYIVSIKADAATTGLKLGEQVKVCIAGSTRDGSIIQATYAGPSDVFVEYEPALETLLYNYGREIPAEELPETDETAEVQTDGSDNDVLLTDATAREVMHIIARRADMETDLVRSYNYFAAARLLARMISANEDDTMRQYYDQRCRVLEILDDFATNGRIDLDRLEKFNSQIMRGSASTPYGIKLRILAAMERPEYTDAVWQVVKETNSDEISQLGRLVIAYNAIDGFKLGEEQRKIREHIYTLLKLDIERQPEQIAGGTESQLVEFKTSAVYPAGGVMRIDVKKQMTELVQVIAGFLNSTGGNLYIGVSDEGYVRGLANDLEYFGSLDKMMLELHNSIRAQIGFIPSYAAYISIQPMQFGEKTILNVRLTPLPNPVQVNGVYYERQGSSTEYVPKNKEDEFLHRRRNLMVAPQATATASPATPAAADIAEVKDSAPAPLPANPEPTPEPQVEPQPSATTSAAKAPSEMIATSRLRRNHLHYEGANDYVTPALFFFVEADGSYQISHDEIWTDDTAALALGLTEEEASQSVLVVYASGHVAKVSVDSLLRSKRCKLCAKEKIVFMAPVSDTDGLLAYFKDDRNVYYKQYFAPESLIDTKPTILGEKIIPGTPVHCETVCAECHTNFTGIQRNGQRVGRTRIELDNDIADSYHRLG